MLNVQCSMLNVQCSMFNVQCSMLNAQCSMLNAQCSMFNVQCSMFPCEGPITDSYAFGRAGNVHFFFSHFKHFCFPLHFPFRKHLRNLQNPIDSLIGHLEVHAQAVFPGSENPCLDENLEVS